MTISPRSDMRVNDARENLREEPARLTRRRTVTTDKFHIPEHLLKEGWSYEWKRQTIMGQNDVEHQVMLSENHWTPVPASQMPGLMPADYSGAVTRAGMVLMARPDYLTTEAEQEILDMSRQRVRTQEQRLGLTDQGTLPRSKPNLSRSVSPLTAAERRAAQIQIPD